MGHKVHKLKTIPPYFDHVLLGKKKFEVRKNDRGFKIGDILQLEEWTKDGGYTGRKTRVKVTYIASGEKFGIDRYCVMGIE